MNGVLIEFLVGLFVLAHAVDGSLARPTFHWVKIVIGLLLVIMAIMGFDLLTL